jgi:Tetratricopeptide repeat
VVQQRPGVTGKPVRLADPPPLLAGREALLAELDARLSGGDDSRPRTVALTGLGGAGKTSVALAYAQRHLGEVGAAWQFAAEAPTVLAAGFGELAAQFGVRDVLDTRDPVSSVHGVLAAFSAGWLLVFDNAPDRASVEAFLPPAGPGRVLITSQNPDWPHGQALDVSVLDAEVSADFLVNRTGDPDERAAVELARELGGLPLALEQAAAYVQATRGSLAGYLASFRRRRPELLAQGEPTGYRGTVATTWALAFAQLEGSAPAAVGLLRLLAFCAPEGIPWRLLLQRRPALNTGLSASLRSLLEVRALAKQDPPAANRAMVVWQLTRGMRRQVAKAVVSLVNEPQGARDAIAALSQYSLVSPAAAGQVKVHRLVQRITIARMPEELAGSWRQAAAAVIEAAIPADPDHPDNWPDFAALLPHVQAALTDDSLGMSKVARYLGSSGSSAAARDLCQRVVDAQSRALGPEHPSTLTAREGLASFTADTGDVAGARDQYAALLPVMERVLGPEHPHALTTRGNFAHITGVAGDVAGARDEYAALLSVTERVSGPEHPSTLTVRGNLARFTGEAGDAAGARDQYAALLAVRERVSGPEHPSTLTVRGNLARFTGAAGDAAGARDQYGAVLPVTERVFGPEHPSTLAARDNLALFTGAAGDAAGARDQYAALLAVRERVSGPEHPSTLTVRGGLALFTGLAGEVAGARDQYAALLPVTERALGPEHPETLTARDNLARFTGEAGDAAGARDQYAALLPVRERVSGPEHPSTLTARAGLALFTGAAEDVAGARDQYAALLPVTERALGPEHPETLSVRENLARFTGEAGDAAGARDQYAALLPAMERVLGPEHPDTLTACDKLAYWTKKASRWRRFLK